MLAVLVAVLSACWDSLALSAACVKFLFAKKKAQHTETCCQWAAVREKQLVDDKHQTAARHFK